MLNGHVESFHGRLRDERLNASWFRTMNDVRHTLAVWHEEYNYAPGTAKAYLFAVKQFAEHFHRSPDRLGAEHIR
jgi:hypothetical protein